MNVNAYQVRNVRGPNRTSDDMTIFAVDVEEAKEFADDLAGKKPWTIHFLYVTEFPTVEEAADDFHDKI